MSKKVCIICLVCETTTRLSCMQAAQNEDERRYECLTGLKLKFPAFICQRCSIDLGLAVNLKQKALESAKMLIPPICFNQFKVPAEKNSPVNNSACDSQMLQNVTLSPINSQMALNKKETPKNQILATSTKTALPSTSNMSRTDKIMSSASIISSSIVNPPISMSKITDLFKNKPNVSLIKTKGNDNEHKDSPLKEQFPKYGLEAKNSVNKNARITNRRKTVCAENLYELQKKTESQVGRKLVNFQPLLFATPKQIAKTEVDKNLGNKQEKAPQKRQAEEVVDQPQVRKSTRVRSAKQSEPTYQYWIKSKAAGYYIETFKNLEEATSYLEKLPPDASYGSL